MSALGGEQTLGRWSYPGSVNGILLGSPMTTAEMTKDQARRAGYGEDLEAPLNRPLCPLWMESRHWP